MHITKTLLAIAGLAVMATAAVPPHHKPAPPPKQSTTMRSIIASYPEKTTEGAVGKAMHFITSNGGKITEKYTLLFKGYAAIVPSKLLQSKELKDGGAVVEEDQAVTELDPDKQGDGHEHSE